MLLVKDADGSFTCPCGYSSLAKYKVERHMGTCKVIKLSRAEETVEGMEEMKEALREQRISCLTQPMPV